MLSATTPRAASKAAARRDGRNSLGAAISASCSVLIVKRVLRQETAPVTCCPQMLPHKGVLNRCKKRPEWLQILGWEA